MGNERFQEDGISPDYTLKDLLEVMTRLRDPDFGCPWDIKQSFESIVPSTLEECYELADAIEQKNMPHVAEELGDVLFQVIFYCQLGKEQALFDFSGVVHALVDKLLRRHPHVFVNGDINTQAVESIDTEAVKANWEAIKRQERLAKSQSGILADIPRALPALPRAQKLQKRAAHVGFDWAELSQVLANLEGEIAELRGALNEGNAEHIEDEFGDVLFSAVNVGRHLNIDAERALRRANRKFERRFSSMESKAAEANKALESMTPLELDALWRAAKQSD
ncbi:nucleoside triphosphate pyrophosphohydrolase [Luminiphilus sp.]|nr:nucleoside triphosphate pyrophosphohydrolase [Luminiphilus sp.]